MCFLLVEIASNEGQKTKGLGSTHPPIHPYSFLISLSLYVDTVRTTTVCREPVLLLLHTPLERGVAGMKAVHRPAHKAAAATNRRDVRLPIFPTVQIVWRRKGEWVGGWGDREGRIHPT